MQKPSSHLKTSTLKAKNVPKYLPQRFKIELPAEDKDFLGDASDRVISEIMAIRKTLNAYLYKHYQIEEKDMDAIYLVKTGPEEETYSFVYQKDLKFSKQLIFVFTDKRGNIITVINTL